MGPSDIDNLNRRQFVKLVCRRRRGNSDYHGMSGAGNICLDSVAKLWYIVTIAVADSINRRLR